MLRGILITTIAASALPLAAIEPPERARPIQPDRSEVERLQQQRSGDRPAPSWQRQDDSKPDIRRPEQKEDILREFEQNSDDLGDGRDRRPRIVDPTSPDAAQGRPNGSAGSDAEAQVSSAPFLGVVLDPLAEPLADHLGLSAGEGVSVLEVMPGSPAEAAGVNRFDILVSISGESVGSPQDVRAVIEKHAVGEEVQVDLLHRGERQKLMVELAKTPDDLSSLMRDPLELRQDSGEDELKRMLGRLPDQHGDMIRRALERNARLLRQMEESSPSLSQGIHDELLERMEQNFGRAGGNPQRGGFESTSTIRLLDENGSIELKTRNGDRYAKVYDPNGTLEWEGPYETEADKQDMPEQIRKRVERLDVDMNFGSSGIRLRFGPQRFRSLEEMSGREVR